VDAPRLLDGRIDGRITPESLGPLTGGVDALLLDGRPFAVVFDRRAMTAPTPDGRRVLEEWAARTMPRMPGRCVAWADVLDERRARSLAGSGRAAPPYPQRTFTDPDEARAWALGALS
jgi:hypothetical protein